MSIDAEALAEPFPKELLRTHPDKNLSYVPISEVVARLNRVLGVGGWGYEVVRVWEAGTQESQSGAYPVWVMAHVRLSVFDGDKLAGMSVDGVGGQQVKMLRSGKGPLDLGDEYKGCVSDALKKAAQHLGVGLELARKDEALAWERHQDAAEAVDGLSARIDAAPHEVRQALRAWWANSGLPPLRRLGLDDVPAVDAKLEELARTAGVGGEVGAGGVSEGSGSVGASAPAEPDGGSEGITPPQRARIMASLGSMDRDDRLARVSALAGRRVGSTNELSKDEAGRVIDALEKEG